MSDISIKYKGLDLEVQYEYHPEQRGDLETEPIEAHIEIEGVVYGECMHFLDAIEALDDVEELTDDVWNKLQEL